MTDGIKDIQEAYMCLECQFDMYNYLIIVVHVINSFIELYLRSYNFSLLLQSQSRKKINFN